MKFFKLLTESHSHNVEKVVFLLILLSLKQHLLYSVGSIIFLLGIIGMILISPSVYPHSAISISMSFLAVEMKKEASLTLLGISATTQTSGSCFSNQWGARISQLGEKKSCTFY